SIIANLKAGRFVRGASTITMQLAKNLFLSREKTVSRKLEELILATYLEKTFRKEELMELYLNVIEFGPDLYGVRAAGMHYFGRRPEELNLAECLFMSSLLPRPREYHKIWEKGELPASWEKNIHQLMDVAQKNGKISKKELDEGMGESIVFHKETDPPPPPRPAITGAHLTGGDDWEPVE
ncbi:MAG TPA: biosynthetic peptidoglycan transglycosylase, partial [Polyangiaceae bacterium]